MLTCNDNPRGGRHETASRPDEGRSVARADLGVFQQALVVQEPDWRSDFDCDGVIARGDLSFFQRHFAAP